MTDMETPEHDLASPLVKCGMFVLIWNMVQEEVRYTTAVQFIHAVWRSEVMLRRTGRCGPVDKQNSTNSPIFLSASTHSSWLRCDGAARQQTFAPVDKQLQTSTDSPYYPWMPMLASTACVPCWRFSTRASASTRMLTNRCSLRPDPPLFDVQLPVLRMAWHIMVSFGCYQACTSQ